MALVSAFLSSEKAELDDDVLVAMPPPEIHPSPASKALTQDSSLLARLSCIRRVASGPQDLHQLGKVPAVSSDELPSLGQEERVFSLGLLSALFPSMLVPSSQQLARTASTTQFFMTQSNLPTY